MKVTGSWDILIPLTILCCKLYPATGGSAVVITNENWENIIKSNDVVLLNFYVDWCRFSKQLEPIFEEAAARIREQFPEDGRVILGKVNCDDESEVANRFDIFKYPTLKVAKSGLTINQEYRGQRSVKAFVEFVERELSGPIKEFQNISELHDADVGDGLVIGYFISRDHEEYLSYRRVARIYRNDCKFMVGFGEVSRDLHPPGENLLIFRADFLNINYKEYYSEYSGNLTNFMDLMSWVSDKCKPLVRDITFDNAEELTEEGLPLLIAFYNKNDLGPVREFQTVVKTQLADEKRVNFLTADGALFGHPLFHMGKSMDDLPVIAIDSFQHMYVFPKFADIHQPGVLKKFIDDLFTGQHHLDYHNPKDSFEETIETAVEVLTPPAIHESKFKELLPSKHRYTLLNRSRDEL
ncbi:endoplasmic reticulum resident protein 44 [Drosophila kikkawai]|uniref:Endoplasmic reticulum resident protein 44 n=1 Tax=Drosophila kikkawai TaxID=30033 RepID=A0A6P4JRE3_DROKI|nr:endoplasmic reticulum resident protein 44 [Drosophila kikkawai]